MRVLFVFDHPYGAGASENVPHRRSLVAAMRTAAVRGLDRGGHTHETVDLAAVSFDPMMTDDDLRAWRIGSAPRTDVVEFQAKVAAADHIVFVFPTWWMAMPAATKGFIDRVFTRGFAFDEPRPGGKLVRRLHRLRGVTVLTAMTTPAPLYRAIFSQPAHRVLGAGTFQLMGIKRFSWFSIDRSSQRRPESRERALARIEQRFAKLK